MKQAFLKYAYEKALRQIGTEADELRSETVSSKPEVAKIDILETREDFVMTQVTGQLIRTGIFQEKAFSESIPFKLAFRNTWEPGHDQERPLPDRGKRLQI